jgi:leucine-rich repeat-containing G protein-coupled receptor 7/leucine-rich repeat-containing G protein-coupled receptor 8
VFVSSLCVADFVMGVYVTIIGTADVVFQGRYLHNDILWTTSKACKVWCIVGVVFHNVVVIMIMWILTL